MQEVFLVQSVNILKKKTFVTQHEYVFSCKFQVLEYDTPQNLLLEEGSAFYKMVQSTGPANAQYLRGLAFGTNNENSCEENR